jgi:hypothetical protein
MQTERAPRAHSHDRHRLRQHHVIDPARVEFCRASVGKASLCVPFGGIFGDPNAPMHHPPRQTARVIRFPERHTELAKLGDAIKEVRGGC